MQGDYLLAELEPGTGESGIVLDKDGKPSGQFTRVQTTRTDKVMIDADGRVIVNGNPAFRLLRGQAADRKAFRKDTSNSYVRAYGDVQRSVGEVKVGYLEKPNFSLVEEMVKMIEVSRAYEANSKVIQAHESTLDRVINSVGPSRR